MISAVNKENSSSALILVCFDIALIVDLLFLSDVLGVVSIFFLVDATCP
jgi:hypothetical protein